MRSKEEGLTPLLAAVKYGRETASLSLLEAEADVLPKTTAKVT